MSNLLFSLIAFAFVLAGPQTTISQPVAHSGLPQMTAEKWREDLRFLAAEMPRVHKNLFHKISKDDFEKAVAHLDARIPSLADHEVGIEIMKLVAMVGDGHTGVYSAPITSPNGVYPVRFYLYEDGLFVQRAAPEFKNIIGGKVIRIGDVSATEAIERVSSIVWHDNEMGIKNAGPFFLSSPQVLHALKISSSLEKVSLTVSVDGNERTADLRPTAKREDILIASTVLVDSYALNTTKPLWMKDPANNFWYEYLPGLKILYVQFNAVQNKPDETVEAFFKRVFEYAEKNPVEKLVFDLRTNGGGNNYLNLPITIGSIKSRLNLPGKFFVIIGRETFSAAQNTVNELEKYTNAVFVGEPTAANPNHFGDARPITLPNSMLVIQASTLWWQDMDERDRRRWKAPDVAAEMTSKLYRAGRDPAMEAIINYRTEQNLNEIVEEQRAKQNVPEFIKKYRAFKSNPAHKYAQTEATINRVGYFLLNANRTDDAIEIFKLNVEAYPQSANVYDSLAEAYEKKGDKQKALENYHKALSVDPNFRSSAEAVKRLNAN